MRSVLVRTAVILLSIVVYDSLILAKPSNGSIVKIFVNTRDGVTREGTAFVIHVSGDPDSPTLYLLTAAHLLVDSDSSDDDKMEFVDSISARYSSGANDYWDVSLEGVRIAPKWYSYGRDFALLVVPNCGRQITAMKLQPNGLALDDEFKAMGYLEEDIKLSGYKGTVIQDIGGINPWFVVSSDFGPGMSGGPAVKDEKVVALIKGRYKETNDAKYLVPISMVYNFLEDNIPNWVDTSTAMANVEIENLVAVPLNPKEEIITTDDHHCEPIPMVRDCRGEPTRKTYVIQVNADPGAKLVNPKLSCVAGPCEGWNRQNSTSLENNDTVARASFDVWSSPTKWVLATDQYRIQRSGVQVLSLKSGQMFTVEARNALTPHVTVTTNAGDLLSFDADKPPSSSLIQQVRQFREGDIEKFVYQILSLPVHYEAAPPIQEQPE